MFSPLFESFIAKIRPTGCFEWVGQCFNQADEKVLLNYCVVIVNIGWADTWVHQLQPSVPHSNDIDAIQKRPIIPHFSANRCTVNEYICRQKLWCLQKFSLFSWSFVHGYSEDSKIDGRAWFAVAIKCIFFNILSC